MRRITTYLTATLATSASFMMSVVPLEYASAEESDIISEVVVTSQRREQPKLLHAGNIERLDGAVLERVQHQHIQELLNRVAGTWIVRGSGQENQAAIRSPVLTGGGSCGV